MLFRWMATALVPLIILVGLYFEFVMYRRAMERVMVMIFSLGIIRSFLSSQSRVSSLFLTAD